MSDQNQTEGQQIKENKQEKTVQEQKNKKNKDLANKKDVNNVQIVFQHLIIATGKILEVMNRNSTDIENQDPDKIKNDNFLRYCNIIAKGVQSIIKQLKVNKRFESLVGCVDKICELMVNSTNDRDEKNACIASQSMLAMCTAYILTSFMQHQAAQNNLNEEQKKQVENLEDKLKQKEQNTKKELQNQVTKEATKTAGKLTQLDRTIA